MLRLLYKSHGGAALLFRIEIVGFSHAHDIRPYSLIFCNPTPNNMLRLVARYLWLSTSFCSRRSTLREDVEEICHAALESVDPYKAVREFVQNDTQIQTAKCIKVASFGKASAAMTAAIIDSVNSNVSGICICKDGHVAPYEQRLLPQIQVYEASHPIPDERGVRASWKLLELINDASTNSLTVCCISGGGSALFCTPKLPLDDLQTTNQRLLESGLDITYINRVRKVLEEGKGGGLHADVALILSDVVGDPLESIASGPTVTNDDEMENWSFLDNIDLPDSVRELLMATPEREPIQKQCRNILVGNNAKAVNAAVQTAQDLGYKVHHMGTNIQGEASKIGRELVEMAESSSLTQSQANEFIGTAWIGGGETTVTLPKKHGLGGRNQELALAAAVAMKQSMILASIGTDGTDGPTDAAGAIVDATTVRDTKAEAVAALEAHDAYPYLEQRKALYKVSGGQWLQNCWIS